MKSRIIYGLQALGVALFLLVTDLALAPWCHDRSRITNKYLILEYLDYSEAAPDRVAENVGDLSQITRWLRVPEFEILEVDEVRDDAASIRWRDARNEIAAGTISASTLEGPNANTIILAVADAGGGLLFQYRLTLQAIAGQTRITHVWIAPRTRSAIVRLGPTATGKMRDRILIAHELLEALLRNER